MYRVGCQSLSATVSAYGEEDGGSKAVFLRFSSLNRFGNKTGEGG
jgi:hypothetical protein